VEGQGSSKGTGIASGRRDRRKGCNSNRDKARQWIRDRVFVEVEKKVRRGTL
jgi:hypothetical protein